MCATSLTEWHVSLVKSSWKVSKYHLNIQQLCFCAQIEIPTRRSCKVFYDVPVGSNINKVFTEICCFSWKEKRKSKQKCCRILLLWCFLVPIRVLAASQCSNWGRETKSKIGIILWKSNEKTTFVAEKQQFCWKPATMIFCCSTHHL